MQNLITKEVKLKMIPWLLIGILGSLLTLGIPYLVQSLLDNGDGKNIFQNILHFCLYSYYYHSVPIMDC